ncbi:MAG: hypothetical protein KAW47_02810, partial [Thermoplasmatales archaeon]|nr:hypothetical protein [Thermoplasmatales archaeon]
DWSISVKNKGFFNRINKSNQGVISVLKGNSDIVANKLVFLGIGRIDITVTAECAECTTVTETAGGIILGYFVILTSTS